MRWYAEACSASGGVGRKLKMEMRLGELGAKASGGQPGGSPLALLAALSRDVPRGLDVVVDEVEQSPPVARVAGHAPSFESVTQLQESLRKGGSFARVDVKDVRVQPDGSVRAVVDVVGKDGTRLRVTQVLELTEDVIEDAVLLSARQL
mgnify:CR=1 FL=1